MPEAVLRVVLREIRAYGQAWRLDWSDFDGRQLRDPLEGVARWAERALKGEMGDPPAECTDGTDFLKWTETR